MGYKPANPDPDFSRSNLHQLECGTEHERVAVASFFREKPVLPDPVLPLLIFNLISTNVLLVEESAKRLGSYGALASNSLPVLTNLLSHPKKYVHFAASNSIFRIQSVRTDR